MSKTDITILIVAATVLMMFLINYFISFPAITAYNENNIKAAELEKQLTDINMNIANGALLEAEILRLDADISAMAIERYYDENYTVHNFFVDEAEQYDIDVGSLSLSEISTVASSADSFVYESIAQNPLVAQQMPQEEIVSITGYYEVVSQSTSMLVTGTPAAIFDYIDSLAKEDIYISLPSLSLSDFVDSEAEISTSLQFIKYMYRQTPQQSEVYS